MATTTTPKVPPAGIWAPAVTFFDPETDELDLEAQKKYYTYLSQHLTGTYNTPSSKPKHVQAHNGKTNKASSSSAPTPKHSSSHAPNAPPSSRQPARPSDPTIHSWRASRATVRSKSSNLFRTRRLRKRIMRWCCLVRILENRRRGTW